MTRKTAERVAVDDKALSVLTGANFAIYSDTEMARRLTTHTADVWRARHDGYVSPSLLRAMAHHGLLDRADVAAVLTVPVTPCLDCGDVHTTKHCPNNRKERKRVRFNNDVSAEEYRQLTVYARWKGMTNGELIGSMWLSHLQWLDKDEFRRFGDILAAAAVEE